MAKNTDGPQRPDNWTISCPSDLRDFAKDRAEELELDGGASELVQRLIVAEYKSKRGIARHAAKRFPAGRVAV